MRIIFYALIVFTFTGAVASANAQTARPSPTPPASVARPTPTPAPAATNAPVPPSKIAIIDTTMFGDEKSGIYRYVDAARILAGEFKARSDEVTNLATRLNALANELDTLIKTNPVNQTVLDAKQQQGAALQTEYNTKKAKLDEDVSKRYQQVVSPISRQIGASLDQFATQRGITMTLDASKILPAILTLVPAADITQAFINDFNSKNPRTAAAPTTPKP
jgi:Skp family chaperone for outer membrane proteins